MKNLHLPILVICIVSSVCFVNCSKDKSQVTSSIKLLNPDSVSFEHSMKGWELYSWPNGNNWTYSILEGTNRCKTLEQVTGNYIIVTGNDSLKILLDKFPLHEEIFWIGEEWLDRIWNNNTSNLTLPDINTLNEIRDYCTQKQLVLSITN